VSWDVSDKSRQHQVDRHGTRWQCLENSCVQCLGEKRVWSNSIFMKFGITHWKVVYHIISGKDSWSISIHFFHLSKHLWHPKVWKSLTTFLFVTSKTRQTAAGCYNQVVVTFITKEVVAPRHHVNSRNVINVVLLPWRQYKPITQWLTRNDERFMAALPPFLVRLVIWNVKPPTLAGSPEWITWWTKQTWLRCSTK